MFTTRSDHQTRMAGIAGVARVAGLASMNRPPLILLALLLLSSSSSALAQTGFQLKDWKPSLNDGAAVKPKRDCGALVGLTGYEFSIETATTVPASGHLADYCHVTGPIPPALR